MSSLLSDNPLPRHALDARQDALYFNLKQLPRRMQQVFLCSRLDNLPFPVIAEQLGIPLATVEHDMLLALEACRTHSRGIEDTISTQASGWYIKLQSPLTTPSERIDFRRWLDAEPLHLVAFHDTELRWRQTLAPAQLLGAGQWYRHCHRNLMLRGIIAAVVALVLAMELYTFL
ncbi:DUF4880 domain-containing protein [Pseudomonas sp. nanlin1]|uniref:DUF4880 domain-containing protein n=1 Tax=Pseudomonas sp. nanlin1 TaxID=3040605 RepID=UPI00388E3E28